MMKTNLKSKDNMANLKKKLDSPLGKNTSNKVQLENQTDLFIKKDEFEKEYIDITKSIQSQKDGKCTNAFKVLSDVRLLKAAYKELKSKPGMMTKGSDEETLDGIEPV